MARALLPAFFIRMTGPRATLLFLYSTLVRTWDAHVFTIFRDGAASYLNTLRLQNPGKLLVGKGSRGIFFFD